MLKCVISGKTTPNLVINKSNGLIYDFDTIEKHLKLSKICPISGEEIKIEDMIKINNNADENLNEPKNLNKIIEDLEKTFSKANEEIDNLLIKNNTLKKELVFLENQNEHGIKYVAKLLKEKEQYETYLSNFSKEIN
jgi:hypothetical protein